MGYYSTKLSGTRLRECYAIAPPRVQQYLEAEVQFVSGRLAGCAAVLELGCGYGRVALALALKVRRVVGIDTSEESLELARSSAAPGSGCEFLRMNAAQLGFGGGVFDAVVCVQNGICAFGVDPLQLLVEAVRVARPGGRVLFSSYSDRFWAHRLQWFEMQAARGLVGAIDRERTGDGLIVCRDGFRAGRMRPEDFRSLCSRGGWISEITEVDSSSVFCEILVAAER
jgi:2-polyprenyl-6-hydroxyphenyl methylase/3-demethylubiquinone-9 3-methyltransferase